MTIEEALAELTAVDIDWVRHEAHIGVNEEHYEITTLKRQACRTAQEVIDYVIAGWDSWLGFTPAGSTTKRRQAN